MSTTNTPPATNGESSLTKGDVSIPSTNGHARIYSESENSLNSSHQSLGSSGGGLGLGGGGGGTSGHHPIFSNTLPHPHHHHPHPHPHHHQSNNINPDSVSPNSQLISSSRTLKHHSSQQETRVTQIIRELQQMGPDGQQMDYSRPNPVSAQGGGSDYGQTGYGTTPRPHYVSTNPPDHIPYDPTLMQDPYYGRGALPPEAGQQRYPGYGTGNYGGGDYDQYPQSGGGDYRNYSGGHQPPSVIGGGGGHHHLHHHHPSTYSYSSDPQNSPPSPSERSDSPSFRPLNSDYMRQAGGYAPTGYPPTGYEEIDSGMVPPPRPEYLTAVTNALPGNYGEIDEERGNNGGYLIDGTNWTHSPPAGTLMTGNGGLNSTSHYGNLPVRPYLLASGTGTTLRNQDNQELLLDNQVPSEEEPSPGVGDVLHGVPNVRISNSNGSGGDPRIQFQSLPGQGGNPASTTSSSSAATAATTTTTNQAHHHNHLHHHHLLQHHHHSNHHSQEEDSPLTGSTLMNNSGVRWRDPDLHEVIQFLGNPNPVVKANAAAYLQHLCYMDDPVKTKARVLGGIPPLVALLSHDQPEVHRNACGALRNLSYGRQNDENKKAIKSAGGIPSLVRLLKKTQDNEVKELISGVLWNLSSCEELKKAIIDDGVVPLVNIVIIPHSGWDRNNISGTSASHIPDACWSTVFKNASGVFRNVSSAGEYARKKLRECEGLVEALLHVVRCALSRADIDDKSVENCVCILRNLSYRCQEVEDPNYDKHPPPLAQNRANAATPGKGENLGCFGANKKKKEAALATSSPKEGNSLNSGTGTTRSTSQVNRSEPISGMELLWQPEVVQAYLALLSNCSNPETLEAAAGAIQNLAACYWQPSIEIRAAVRKEKGLPVLVELLRMEVDRVVCAVATALRNLAIDQRNKELIGKYAMRDLVQKLPSGRPNDQGTSDDTIAAVLATLNEVIKKNAEFSRSLLEAEGVERLVFLTQQKRRFSPRVVKFASQVLYSLWQHQELREVYKKAGWTEQDFVSKGSGGRSGSPGPGGSGTELNSAGSPVNNANSTLNRPMASQSGTRYEDKTMQRGNNSVPKSPPSYSQAEEVPLGSSMPYPDGSHAPPPGAFRMYPSPPVKPGEPLYAQVNREKKKNRGFEGPNSRGGYGGGLYNSSPSGETTQSNWQESTNSVTHSIDNLSHQPAGDSWV